MSKSPIHRHLPFLIAFPAGIAATILLSLLHPKAALVGGAITFFVIYLVHTATRLPYLTANTMKTNQASADEPAGIILLITFGASVVAVVSLFSCCTRRRHRTHCNWRCRSPRSRWAGSPSTP